MVLAIVAVAAFAFAGYLFFRGSRQAEFPSEYRISGVCLACKAEATATSKISERPPFDCLSCRKQAVFPWYFCGRCQRRFVPNLERSGGTVRLPIVPACPKCGSTSTGSWVPDDPEQKPGGADLPLPAWP